ncbi:hypothetical protein DICPUDRAFT_154223 [Dictyostelium purpureum]|uniref:Protein kinase domain-containing protein n=1 Tax=Dictyostelium purpureum TaxID=5786 RepID=F0ZQS5_DICPU|nr:uncharacterized protein DICPUDRAFT_154223 [Dictyostelium purpureum]EGC33703.1 hypothetical protein DICPUDRAFT_154223 [Dictyostelium purpureum]|eukprot:XP_003289780.1 hypothetical protein DICPUDRAFT_154223 [Dictyostelium purpureum]
MNSFEKRLLLLKKDEKESFMNLVKQLLTKEKTILFDIIDSKLRKIQSSYIQKPFNLKYLQTFIKDDDEDDDDESEKEDSDNNSEDEDKKNKKLNGKKKKEEEIEEDHFGNVKKVKKEEKEEEEPFEEIIETKIIPKKPILNLNSNKNIPTDINNNSSDASLKPTSLSNSTQQPPQQGTIQRIQSIQNLMRTNSIKSLLFKPLYSQSQSNLDDTLNNDNINNNNSNSNSDGLKSTPSTSGSIATSFILPNNLESIFDESNKIGEGGHSVIYRYMGCALKKFKSASSLSSSAEVSSLFENEVSILEKLDHSNIIKIITSSTLEKIILLEYMDQGSLEKYPQQQPLEPKQHSPRQLIDIQIQHQQLPNPLVVIQDMQSVVDAMIYLHYEKSILHLDLKPSNILKSSSGEIKLIDFGISKSSSNSPRHMVNMGSYRYTSPEFFNNSSVGRASDVFSFGIMLWELLNWRIPYESLTRDQIKNIKNEMERESHLPLDHLPISIQDLIRLCWKQDPSIRPDFKDIKSRLEEIITSSVPINSGKIFWKNCCGYKLNGGSSSNNNSQVKILESIPWQDFKSYLLSQIKIDYSKPLKTNINNNNNNNKSNSNNINTINKLSPYHEYMLDYIKYILKVSEKNKDVTVDSFARFYILFSPISSSLFRSVQNFCDIQGMYGYCVKKDFIPSSSMLNSLNGIGYLLFLDPVCPNYIYLKIKSKNNSSGGGGNSNSGTTGETALIDFTIRIKINNYHQKTFQCHGYSSSTLSGLLKELQQVIEGHNGTGNTGKKANSKIFQRSPISEIKDRYLNGFYFNQNRLQ